MIDNPAYKGEWAPRKIPNPNYFEDSTPVKSLVPIGGVGIELWTMTEDILFDNIYIGHSVEDARKLAEETYFVKKAVEEAIEKEAAKEDEVETPVTFKEDPVEFIRSKVFKFVDLAKIDPVLAFKTHPETGAGLTLSVITLFGMLGVLLGFAGAQQKPITKVCISCLLCHLSSLLTCVPIVDEEDRCAHRRRQDQDREGACRACRWRAEGDDCQEAEVKGIPRSPLLSRLRRLLVPCSVLFGKLWQLIYIGLARNSSCVLRP